MDAADYGSSSGRVKAWREAAALHIRFDNPAKRNALSLDMWEAVPPLLERAERDEAVRYLRTG